MWKPPTDEAPVTKPVVLAVEGADEFYLFVDLCRREGIRDRMHIHNLRGRDGLTNKLGALARTTGFKESARAIGVVIDAENGTVGEALSAASEGLSAVVETLVAGEPPTLTLTQGAIDPLPTPRGALHIGSLIVDKCLDEWCLSTVAGDPKLVCVDGYIACLMDKVSRPEWPKRRLRAYLTAFDDPTMTVGRAAKDDHWHFEDECWSPLKRFLRDLVGVAK
ncbi:MAG TPA: DUF3226 domain-containing protein [Armatimonadota bacterium]|nr:DUF3226 domain-containing protein [Armatimonadota bacterium]